MAELLYKPSNVLGKSLYKCLWVSIVRYVRILRTTQLTKQTNAGLPALVFIYPVFTCCVTYLYVVSRIYMLCHVTRVCNDEECRRAGIERELASRGDQRVLRWLSERVESPGTYVIKRVSRGHFCLALCSFGPPSRALVVITWRGVGLRLG